MLKYSPAVYNFVQRVVEKMITFDPFWHTLKEKNISVYELLEKRKFSHGTYDSIKKNRNVTLNTINQLCEILDCKVEDIIEYKYDEE